MKYKSEMSFTLPEHFSESEKDRYIERGKMELSLKIGEMIGEAATWQQVENTHILEVEAFSINHWREFKDEIRLMIKQCQAADRSTFDLIQVAALITRLENKGIEKSTSHKLQKQKL